MIAAVPTEVERGSVVVHDLVKRKNVVVQQGQRYLARNRKPRAKKKKH